MPSKTVQTGTHTRLENGKARDADGSMFSDTSHNLEHILRDDASSLPATGFSIFERSVEEGSAVPSVQMPDEQVEQPTEIQQTANLPNLPQSPLGLALSKAELSSSSSEGEHSGTPAIDVIRDVDSNGWTTVVSKKHKPRT